MRDRMAAMAGRAALGIFLLLALPGGGCVSAQAAISGSASRPFPVLMPIDYAACRALAWFDALNVAVREFPAFAGMRLDELEMDSELGRMALCALVYPVDVVTPDISVSNRIVIYLRAPGDVPKRIAAILRNPDQLAMEMCLISELRSKLDEIGALWPASLLQARERMAELEALSAAIDGLWHALGLNAAEEAETAAFERMPAIAGTTGKSIGVSLMLANFQLRAKRPQRALEAADCAVREAGRIAGENDLWQLMLGKALALRGQAHWRLGQLALAEADMNAAERSLSGFERSFADLPAVLLARGALRGLRHDRNGMCADFLEACVLGKCEGLAAARGRGECQNPN